MVRYTYVGNKLFMMESRLLIIQCFRGLVNNSILCITEDNKGNLWFSSNGGVSRYDGKSFTNYTTAQGLANDVVYWIAEDKTGNLWFATFGGGVSRYDGENFNNYTIAQGF